MIAALLLATTLMTASADTLVDGSRLVDVVQLAVSNHPSLTASQARAEAAQERARQVGSLPDMRFSWGEMIESVETRVGPQQRILSLQQPLPWPGTLGAREDAAMQRSGAAGSRVVDRAITVAAAVQRTWAEAAWLGETQLVATQQLSLARSLETAARASYEAGSGRYGDLLQAQLEIARLEDRLVGLGDQQQSAMAALNAALGRGPNAPLILPATLPEAADLAAPETEAVHPRLLAHDQEAVAALGEATAARRAGHPTFTLGVDWIQVGEAPNDGVPDSGKDAWVARVGVSLPLWRGKYDGAIAGAEAEARAITAERRAVGQDLAARTTRAEVRYRDAQRRVTLHTQELLPRARQMYDTVLAAYRTDGVGFAEILTAQRTLLDLEHALLAARRDLLVSSADWNEARGLLPADLVMPERTDS